MGRNKNRKVDDSDEDTFSTVSSTEASVSSDLSVTVEQDEGVVIEGYIDSLYEKRSSTREAGLKGLIGALTSNVMTDFVQDKHDTLVHLFLGCVKRGSSTEAALASRALGLVVLTAGAGSIAEHVLEEAAPHLIKLSKTSSSPGARIAAVEALGIITFVGDANFTGTESSMEVFRQIFSHKGNEHSNQTLGATKPTPPVKAAAISSWSLLLSVLGSDRIHNNHMSSLPVLSSLLEVQDLGVRKAAGEAIALMYEATTSSSDSGDEAGPAIPRPNAARVVNQMKALAVDAGRKGQTKKERSEQRSLFRDVLASIEDGVCKETAVKLQHGDVFRVNTWTQTVQLNSLRRFLAEGFQKHMQENDLLHEVFNFVPRAEKETSMNPKQKRLFMSPSSVLSKHRTLTRKKLMAVAGRHSTSFDQEEE